jgi:hypothetical protein
VQPRNGRTTGERNVINWRRMNVRVPGWLRGGTSPGRQRHALSLSRHRGQTCLSWSTSVQRTWLFSRRVFAVER